MPNLSRLQFMVTRIFNKFHEEDQMKDLESRFRQAANVKFAFMFS